MSQHTGQTSLARRQAQAMRGLPTHELHAVLTETLRQPARLDGDPLLVALDHNARLITELRMLGIWPPR